MELKQHFVAATQINKQVLVEQKVDCKIGVKSIGHRQRTFHWKDEKLKSSQKWIQRVCSSSTFF